jgi:tetratricopeptide (TPR) repeat protein
MSRRALCAALLFSICIPGWCADDDYRLGVEAFKQGRYEEARERFAREYAAGAREPTLLYNLGSAQFKLGDYPAARRSFEAVANDPKWGALAQYNLGLIEERLGNVGTAQRHYRVAYATAQSDKLKELAALKVNDRYASASDDDDDWFGIVSLGTGYDDNVVLLNDQSLVGVSNQSDYFAEALASASGFVQGDVEHGWRADAVGYYRGYRDLSDFDYGTTTLGMTYNTMTSTAQWQFGARANAQFVGGDVYTASAIARAQLLKPLGAYRFRGRNDLSYVDGADHFGYLTGWQDRISVQIDRRVGAYVLRAGYEFEWNDRRDSSTSTEFFSYSPVWNRLYVEAVRSFGDALELELRAAYEFSRYDDENVEVQPNGAVSTAARDDDRFAAALRVTYHPFDSWNVYGEYAYSNNSSKFSQYEYTDNQVMLGVERPF